MGLDASWYEHTHFVEFNLPRFFLVSFVSETLGIGYHQAMWLLWLLGVLGIVAGLLGIVTMIKELIHLYLRKRTEAERLSIRSTEQL